MQVDITSKYADYAMASRFDDLPAEAIDGAKALILAPLGVIIAEALPGASIPLSTS